MNNPALILCLCISIAVCFLVPLTGILLLRKKAKKIIFPFMMGVVAFTVSQIILRMPLLQLLGTIPQFNLFAANAVPYSLFLGLTAGLFEETARFIIFGMMKKHRRFTDGLAFGFGHGGIEAILLAGLSYITILIIMVASGNGNMANIPPQTLSAIQSLTPLMALIGGLERVTAICLHVSLSVVVLYGYVCGKRWIYLIYAILAHALVDIVAVLIMMLIPDINVLIIEGIILVMAVLVAVWANQLKNKFPEEQTPDTDGLPIQPYNEEKE